jgi:hypothetical protein
MKLCALCQLDQVTTEAVAVMPATWNGFNSIANVCEPCQQTRKFKTWARTAATKARQKSAMPVSHTDTIPVPGVEAVVKVEITHRQTGALLHTVEAKSLAGSALSRAALCNANLHHAEMRGADLRWADLHLADLRGADLRSADLRAGNLRGTDLRAADLREARLHGADLRHSLHDEDTQWPAGFDARAAGSVVGPRR